MTGNSIVVSPATRSQRRRGRPSARATSGSAQIMYWGLNTLPVTMARTTTAATAAAGERRPRQTSHVSHATPATSSAVPAATSCPAIGVRTL